MEGYIAAPTLKLSEALSNPFGGCVSGSAFINHSRVEMYAVLLRMLLCSYSNSFTIKSVTQPANNIRRGKVPRLGMGKGN